MLRIRLKNIIFALLGVMLGGSFALSTGNFQAQPILPPKAVVKDVGPAPGTAMTMAYVQSVGRMAYLWGWPLVNSHNRRAAIARAPYPGLHGGVLPVAPVGRIAMLTDYIKPQQNFIACPNQDVVYGGGYFALDKQPVVLQVPDFGERFWVYALYDARTDEFAEIGKPYQTKPGFYLLVGPNWKGEPPAGINAVFRSSTELAVAVPRIFRDDTAEDFKALQPLLNQIAFYPLSEYDGKFKSIDWSKLPHFPAPKSATAGEVTWVDPEKFFDQLPDIMKLVAPLPGEESLYKWIGSVLDAAAREPHIKQILKDTAVAAEKEMIAPLLQWSNNGAPAGNGWNSPVNNAMWGTDYLNRTSTAKSNMYQNKPKETKYIYTDNDSQGRQLHGKYMYSITFPKGELPPVKGFWSLTLYNEHHFFHANELNRFSLGTKSKGLKANGDGSLTIYAGSISPGKDKESNWLPAPNETFSLYIRAYWAEKSLLDGHWQPPAVRRIGQR